MSLYKLASVISAHAWSPDGNAVAVCENEPLVKIYSGCNNKDVKKWKVEHVLDLHTMVVTGIDWSPVTNKIVTCSQDVNAFVWTYDNRANEWVAKVSVLRIERAAIRAKWSPDGNKFAVASSSKVACVSYFDAGQDWWVSKLTKRGMHKSTVLDVAWHPSSQMFATASCDFKCRVFSAYLPAVDGAPANTFFGSMDSTEFGQLLTFFESTGAWIEGCAWSPSGNSLAFVGHDSTISFVSFSGSQPVCTMIKTNGLPLTKLLFVGETTVAAAGHGFQPDIYQMNGGQWGLLGNVDSGKGAPKAKKGGIAGRMNVFASRVDRGQEGGRGSDDLKFLHQNVITDMNVFKDGFSTSGSDGHLVVWSKGDIKKTVPGAQI